MNVCVGWVPAVEHYKYMEDLKTMESSGWPVAPISEILQQVHTPLRVSVWEECLRSHPDREFAEYITQGLTQGFTIGFHYQDHVCCSARSNMQSAGKNPLVVCDYLRSETKAGTLIGPLEKMAVPGLHINRLGVIPKLQQPGKWRLIVDLSCPRKHSVNDWSVEGVLLSEIPFSGRRCEGNISTGTRNPASEVQH